MKSNPGDVEDQPPSGATVPETVCLEERDVAQDFDAVALASAKDKRERILNSFSAKEERMARKFDDAYEPPLLFYMTTTLQWYLFVEAAATLR